MSYLGRIENRLKLGDHLCSFYETKEEQFRIVLPFIKAGLDKREKCIYIGDENTAAEIKAGLFSLGVDVERHLQSGQLKVVTAKETYLQQGRFDPDAMNAYVTSTVSEALKEGYSAVRGAAEMTWILQELSSLDEFWEYEAKLTTTYKELPYRGLCQYNTKRFFGDILMRALRTHPRVLLGLDLYENPFYEP